MNATPRRPKQYVRPSPRSPRAPSVQTIANQCRTLQTLPPSRQAPVPGGNRQRMRANRPAGCRQAELPDPSGKPPKNAGPDGCGVAWPPLGAHHALGRVGRRREDGRGTRPPLRSSHHDGHLRSGGGEATCRPGRTLSISGGAKRRPLHAVVGPSDLGPNGFGFYDVDRALSRRIQLNRNKTPTRRRGPAIGRIQSGWCRRMPAKYA